MEISLFHDACAATRCFDFPGASRARKSCASEDRIFTCAHSPGSSCEASSMCTTPSISGASALERATAPSADTSSTSTLMVLPTWRSRRRALIRNVDVGEDLPFRHQRDHVVHMRIGINVVEPHPYAQFS